MTERDPAAWLTVERRLHIPGGLLGLPEWQDFHWVPRRLNPLLGTLRAEDEAGPQFLAGDPRPWFDDYDVRPSAADLAALQAEAAGDTTVLVLLRMDETSGVSANALGPLLIHPASGLAKQVLLAGSTYRADEPLLALAPELLSFPEGLIGYPECTRMRQRSVPGVPGLGVLEALHPAGLSLTVLETSRLGLEYKPRLTPADRLALHAGLDDPIEWCVVVDRSADGSAVTANLLGPIAIHRRRGVARQVIQPQSGYSAAHPLWQGAPSEEDHAGSDAQV